MTNHLKYNDLIAIHREASRRLCPANRMEYRLLNNESFLAGINWGFPRYGHPEGKVVFHIEEILKNIECIKQNISPEDYERLRLIAYLHDTFKYVEDKRQPRDWSKHHAVLAREFAEKMITDQHILKVVELHDEAYYAWRMIKLHRRPYVGEVRKQSLLDQLGDSLQLYYLFFKCDTRTGDKIQAPVHWFEQTTAGIQIIDF